MTMQEAEAKSVLEAVVQRQATSFAAALTTVMSTVPDDAIVKAGAIRFFPDAGLHALKIGFGDKQMALHHHALRQVGEIAAVPAAYIDRLVGGDAWQVFLLGEILRTTYGHSEKRHLVRSVNNEVRAVLSDRFRRLDSRPLLETFIAGVRAFGAQPTYGTATDLRCSLKVTLPRLVEILPGEWVAVGIEFHNSDYGAGKLSLRVFVLRLRCINGATAEDAMARVHLGGRLDENIEYSEKTYRLDTEATRSALGDVVKHALAPESIGKLSDRLRILALTDVNWEHLKAKLSKVMSKDELRRTDEAYNGPDVLNLPADRSVWRASNAVSWIAQQVEDADHRLDLERLAGSLLLPAGVKETIETTGEEVAA